MTTEQATRVVPAGWYQDPANPANVRWWNGITWTDHVELKPAGQQAAAAGALALEARAMEREFGISTAENDIITSAATGIPIAHPRTGTIAIVGAGAAQGPDEHRRRPGSSPSRPPSPSCSRSSPATSTSTSRRPRSSQPSRSSCSCSASCGRSATPARSPSAVTSLRAPLLALALPVVGPLLYLVVRRLKVDGSKPLIASLVLFALSVGIPLAGVATGGASVITKPLEVQQAVRADLVGTGSVTSVSCPPILESVAAGTVFTCDAVLPSGETVHVWVSFDNEQGQFSWALANR